MVVGVKGCTEVIKGEEGVVGDSGWKWFIEFECFELVVDSELQYFRQKRKIEEDIDGSGYNGSVSMYKKVIHMKHNVHQLYPIIFFVSVGLTKRRVVGCQKKEDRIIRHIHGPYAGISNYFFLFDFTQMSTHFCEFNNFKFVL